jgi:hypothetical protein
VWSRCLSTRSPRVVADRGDKPDDHMVHALEDALALARSGKLHNMVLLYFSDADTAVHCKLYSCDDAAHILALSETVANVQDALQDDLEKVMAEKRLRKLDG